MPTTTTDVILTIMFLLGMALFGLAMLAVALRVGPRRGFWNQPAANLRHPGSRVIVGLYVFAFVHLALGLYITFFIEPQEFGVLVVCVLMAAFYVLCGHSYQLAHRVARGRAKWRTR